jgi:ribonuclease D
VIAHPDFVNTPPQIEELARVLRQAKFVAFDTEFIRETSFYPIVEIIQIATDTDSWLVDAQAFGGRKAGTQGGDRNDGADKRGLQAKAALAPLLDIFRDPNILKIGHALQGDQECLYTSFGVIASPSVDTAVAASLCGYGDNIGLANLLRAVMHVNLGKGHARTNWSVRPLPHQLVEYAHADVIYLVELWKKLEEELLKLNRRDWALRASAKLEDKRLYQADPEGLAEKLASGGRIDKRTYAVLRELVKWREERVRQLNLPRRWIADDNVLIDLAKVRPQDLNHLAAFRGLSKGELKNSGQQILDAIVRGSQAADIKVPSKPREEPPSAEESQAMDLFRAYLGILADSNRIALRHLVTSSSFLAILRSRDRSPAELIEKGLLSEDAGRLIGQDIVDFVNGKRALSINEGRVKVIAT